MNRKLITLVLVAMLAFPLAIFAQSTNTTAAPSMTVPINGTTSLGGKVTGTFQIQKFANQNNKLVAIGNLVAQVTQNGTTRTITAAGTVMPVVTPKTITAGVTPSAASCDILNLTLGPLDLNLLGLQVHLNQVVLNITAQPGAGNLLGNLLCDIAGLLNGGGLLDTLVADLNQLLGLLSNL